jgi:ribosome silencing factor RsfS/YbeB/iojap
MVCKNCGAELRAEAKFCDECGTVVEKIKPAENEEVVAAETTVADVVEEKLTQAGFEPDHIEGKATGWILLDYCGVVIHIFTKETREYYNLDRMWDDGKKIEIDSLLTSAREE